MVYTVRKTAFLLAVLILLCSVSGCNAEKTPEIDDIPILHNNAALFSSDGTVWSLQADADKYSLYVIDENSQKDKIPYPGYRATWNSETEKLYFLQNKDICEFDPRTGKTYIYPTDQEYRTISAVDNGYIFLQKEIYGEVTMFSLESNEYSILSAKDYIIGAFGGYLFLEDIWENTLTCFDYLENSEVWTVDISDLFAVTPKICVRGDDLYMACEEYGYIYKIPDFAQSCEIVKLDVSAKVLAMINTEEYIVFAGGPDPISFYALHDDGTREKISALKDANYYLPDSALMTVSGGKLYFALKTEDGIFCCDLI